MKKAILLTLLLGIVMGCTYKQRGTDLSNIPKKLDTFLVNHVHAFHYPTIYELSDDMVERFYETQPTQRHPSFLEGDFTGDALADYAFILPLKTKDSIIVIINGKKENAVGADYRFFYFGLNDSYKDDYLTLEEGLVMRNSESGSAVSFEWNEKLKRYTQEGRLRKIQFK